MIETAQRAEHWNLASIWIGDPTGAAPHSADSHVTTIAGAVSSVTSTVRIGLFLGLGITTQVVRLAEDLGVLDQATNGRIEIGLVPPEGAVDAWLRNAAALINAYHAWPVPHSDELLPVIPGPAQPDIPRLVVDNVEAADRLHAGRLLTGAAGEPSGDVGPRTVLRVALAPSVPAWLRDDAVGQMCELRAAARVARAREVLLVAARQPTIEDMEALGTVVVPALRAADRDVRAITGDAVAWLTTKRHLHSPPETATSRPAATV
jgi:alkanesulfonate monooxygenase SsuD/methylene tetrahydromethanopterin reductase-like flavin-dependent oxidoreductase (luciferase family)